MSTDLTPIPAADELRIGDFAINPRWVAVPGATFPVAGTTWTIDESQAYRQETPMLWMALGVVLAIFTCFLSLLLLLIRERVIGGIATVSVVAPGGGPAFATRVVVPGPAQLGWLRGAVSHVQAWSASGWSGQG